jgi:catechol 2,3-dioxygenase
METGALPAETGMGAVHLTVSDLEQSVAYWTEVIGLTELASEDGQASLGAGSRELIGLVEEPGAATGHGYTGLYHVALLVPTRLNLARFLAHAARERVPLVGLSDHYVSEAIYLSDPDGHGIEVYADRPREVWQGEVGRRLTTMPLDVQDLLRVLDDPATEPFEGLADGTVVGHVHLKVADVPESIAFYRDVLGFGLMASLGNQAAFLAAGGYHHHVGANVWESRGAPPPPPGTAALRHATVLLPSEPDREAALDRVRATGQEPQGALVSDPSGNRLELAVG